MGEGFSSDRLRRPGGEHRAGHTDRVPLHSFSVFRHVSTEPIHLHLQAESVFALQPLLPFEDVQYRCAMLNGVACCTESAIATTAAGNSRLETC